MSESIILKNKIGFTLAETLITLVIVGIIAALTIPNLIVKYQKEETATRLKKAYSMLAQAVKLSEIDNGITDSWDYSKNSEEFYNAYLKKYIINAKDFGLIDMETLGIKYKLLNGSTADSGLTIYKKNYRITLNDGSMLIISNAYGDQNHKIIYTDINGFKTPNKFGRDMFVFTIQAKYKVTPWGMGNAQENAKFGSVLDRNILIGNNKWSCNKQNRGYWCSALIMADNWKISDDYPW